MNRGLSGELSAVPAASMGSVTDRGGNFAKIIVQLVIATGQTVNFGMNDRANARSSRTLEKKRFATNQAAMRRSSRGKRDPRAIAPS